MKRRSVHTTMIGIAVTALIGGTAILGNSLAQADELSTLKGVPLPLPSNLYDVIKDKDKAIALGKALFWERQVGSDGQACASCHFHAGADNRTKNQVNPGFRSVVQDQASQTFQDTHTGVPSGPNYQLRKDDFPLHQLANKNDRNSDLSEHSTTHDSNKDVVSSQGTYGGSFSGFFGTSGELCVQDTSESNPFQIHYKLTRKVEPRNTPTTINAIFQFRTFWDGRANNIFNGRNPFGMRDVGAKVLVTSDNVTVSDEFLRMNNAALASQAAGPPGSNLEMACSNRAFQLIGRKLLTNITRPLFGQKVASDDSVFSAPYPGSPTGTYVHGSTGLTVSYTQMIKDAFKDKYWNAPGYLTPIDPLNPTGPRFTMMEENFSLYFSLAVMMYESTLVSDDTPFDNNTLTPQQERGKTIFTDKGKCIACHKGPDFTGAGFVLQAENQEGGLVERMEMGKNGVALYDNGFYNIGVTPTNHDLGVGENDPFPNLHNPNGNPLSFTRQFKRHLANGLPTPDPFEVKPCTFEADPCVSVTDPNHRDAVDGAFKTPTLRNVELTGPYMHNGGMSTLEQVVEFYNRGGNRRTLNVDPNGVERDTTEFNNPEWGNNPSNLDADITSLGLNAEEQADLVAFLKALTDERVRCEKAPFDHPALVIPNGHSPGDGNNDGRLDDSVKLLTHVGKNGRAAAACLKPFEATLPN